MTEHLKFPSIGQFRNVVMNVGHRSTYTGNDESGEPIYNHAKAKPTLTFRGTVKLHGTNASIIRLEDGSFQFQARETILTPTSDNAGFCNYFYGKATLLARLFSVVELDLEMQGAASTQQMGIYGEWIGKGINSGASAVSKMEKRFVAFKALVDDTWYDIDVATDDLEEGGIWSIEEVPTYTIDIDFNFPEAATPKLAKITEEVEAVCPYGKLYGAEGVGEGVVWTCVTPGWEDSKFWFKVKGEKHSASKVRTLAVADVEAMTAIRDFVDYAVTENRLQQGWTWLSENGKAQTIASMGDFIRWVHGDVVKEESDTLAGNGIDVKKIGGPLATKARAWYVTKLNESVGLK